MSNIILITGATGNIGSKLTVQLLARQPHDRIILLVRGRSNDHARERVLNVLQADPDCSDLHLSLDRLEVVAGDITADRLDLDDTVYDQLCRSVTHIVHSAASTCFTLPLAESRLINYTGTVNVMDLALQCQSNGNLKAVAHVSTAYVNGPSTHPIREDLLADRTTFFNSYDRTKWEAECYVQSLADQLPLLVFRPSTMVGDSKSGHTGSFNVLYVPMRLISGNRVRLMPGYSDTVLDVVPSDYVADAIRHITFQRPIDSHRVYHLVAGYDQSMTVGGIIRMGERVFGTHGGDRCVRFVSPETLDTTTPEAGGNDPRVNSLLRVFGPFCSSRREFDNSNAREALRSAGVHCPPFAEYIRACLGYCVQSDWGRVVSETSKTEKFIADRCDRQPLVA